MVKVDTTLCDRCGACVSVCPVDALEVTETALFVSDACIVCKKCIALCPFAALYIDTDDGTR